MAYPYTPYGYYGQPVPDQLTQLRQQQFQQPQMPQQAQSSMVWVNNEAEAMSYMVAPNCAVAMWDINNPLVYLKQADASGRPSFKAFELHERAAGDSGQSVPQNEYASIAQLKALEQKVDRLLSTKEEDNG